MIPIYTGNDRGLSRWNPPLLAATLGRAILIALAISWCSLGVRANGVNQLGPIPVSPGSKILSAQSSTQDGGTISIAIPQGCVVRQVLLYWHGRVAAVPPAATDEVLVNWNPVTGALIGWTSDIDGTPFGAAYRADLTGAVDLGNPISVSGLNFDARNNGFVLLVICDDGTSAHLDVRDGDDFAFRVIGAATVGQTFNFASAPVSRTAELTLAVADVGSYEACAVRPHRVRIVVGGVETFWNQPFDAGDDFDVRTLTITVPAGATSIYAEVESLAGSNECLDASLFWVVAALAIQDPPPVSRGTGTPGYWKNHPSAWCTEMIVIGGKTYSKTEAIALMKLPVAGDKSLNLFEQLVAAMLNVGCNHTESSCIDNAILAANAFLATYPAGSGVRANSQPWKQIGGPLHDLLDAYNNGRLCAPSRDSLEKK